MDKVSVHHCCEDVLLVDLLPDDRLLPGQEVGDGTRLVSEVRAHDERSRGRPCLADREERQGRRSRKIGNWPPIDDAIVTGGKRMDRQVVQRTVRNDDEQILVAKIRKRRVDRDLREPHP